MTPFSDDLDACNRSSLSCESRTAHYSPLCHNSALYFGLSLMRHSHPRLIRELERDFSSHATALLMDELDQVALGSLRAFQLFAL